MEPDYKILSEHELIALFCENNQHAFTEIYHRYSPIIYSYARRIIHDESIVDDILQEVFIVLWEKRSGLEISVDLVHYLFGIARYSILRDLRKTRQFQGYQEILIKKLEQLEASPEEFIINKERTAIIEIEIERLPERMKQIIKLSRSGKYTQNQIAEQFNLSTSAVKNQVYYASKKLRLKLHKFLFTFL